MTENKRYIDGGEDHTEKRYKLANPNNVFKDMNIGIVEDNTCMLKLVDVVNLLNEQEETIQELLKYKYLVKALEEVSGGYIGEIIYDYAGEGYEDEKSQLELGKICSEQRLSWGDRDVYD